MRDPQDALSAFEAQERVALVLAQLSPRVCYADRVRLVRELCLLYQSSGLDNLSTFKAWAAQRTGLGEKSIQRANSCPVDDEVLRAMVARGIPPHGQEAFIKRQLVNRSPEQQKSAVAAWTNEPDAPLPPPTGEVYDELGARLECCDSRAKLGDLVAEGRQVTLAFCDPPYGINLETARGQRVTGDDKAPLWCIEPLKRLLKPGGHVALWVGAETMYEWGCALSAAGFAYVAVPWDKINPIRKGREAVLIGRLDRRPPHPDFVLRHAGYPSSHPLQKAHATPKPPEVMTPILHTLTRPGDEVLDPFAGTASIGVAAIQTERRYLGYELVPGHFDTGRNEMMKAVAAHGPGHQTLALAA